MSDYGTYRLRLQIGIRTFSLLEIVHVGHTQLTTLSLYRKRVRMSGATPPPDMPSQCA